MRIVIPTMPARSQGLWQLIERLGGVWPDAVLRVLPTTGDSREDVRRVALALSESPGDWALLMEDDAWPCPDLGVLVRDEVLPRMNKHVGGCSLFSRRKGHESPGIYRQAPRALSYAVGMLLRPDAVRDMADWLPGWYAKNPQHYHALDVAIGEWLALGKWEYRVVSPTLVQHRPGRSSFVGRGYARTSKTFTESWGEAPEMP
jgi:hypothetical protein